MINILSLIEKYGSHTILLGLLILTVSTFILALLERTNFTLFIISILIWISLGLYFLAKHIASKPKSDNKKLSCWTNDASRFDTHCNQRILDIIFVVLLTAILLILQTSTTRPYLYLVLITLAVLTIAISALISKPPTSQIRNVIKSLVLGVLATLSIFKIYYMVGWDTWVHMVYNGLLAKTGMIHIVFGKEASYPIQHVFIAIAELCTGVDVRITTIIIFTISGILLSVIIYQIAGKYFGSRLAVIALLLFITFTYTIYWLVTGIPTSYAGILYLPLMCIFFKFLSVDSTREKWLWIGLYLFFILIIAATHMFSIFIIAFITLAFYIASIIYENKILTKIFPLMMISILIIIIYWLLVNWGFNIFIQLIDSSLTAFISPTSELEIEQYVNLKAPDDFRLIFTNVWVPITVCVFLVASYVRCSKGQGENNLNSPKNIWYILIPYFTCLLFFGVMYLVYPAMVIRITAYIVFFYALAMVYIFYCFIKSKTGLISLRSILVILLIISLICFMNLSQPAIYSDNTPWYTETTVSNSYSWMEITGSNTIANLITNDSNIYSDSYLMPVLISSMYWSKYDTSNVVPSVTSSYKQIDWLSIDLPEDDYLIFRDRLLTSTTENSYQYGKTENERVTQLIQLPKYFKEQLDDEFNCLYDNYEIQLYAPGWPQ